MVILAINNGDLMGIFREGTEEHDDFKQPPIGNLEGLRGNDDDFYMIFTIKNGD